MQTATTNPTETSPEMYVSVLKTWPSGSSIETADDQRGAIDEDHAIYWSLREHDANVEAW